jgi:hypothetical protein
VNSKMKNGYKFIVGLVVLAAIIFASGCADNTKKASTPAPVETPAAPVTPATPVETPAPVVTPEVMPEVPVSEPNNSTAETTPAVPVTTPTTHVVTATEDTQSTSSVNLTNTSKVGSEVTVPVATNSGDLKIISSETAATNGTTAVGGALRNYQIALNHQSSSNTTSVPSSSPVNVTSPANETANETSGNATAV